MTSRIVIVGAGAAGAAAACTLRRGGYPGQVVLLGAEASLPYRRPMVSKEMLAGTAPVRRTLLETADSWHALEVDVRPDTRVAEIDIDCARVEMADGGALGYDALLLATGARARRLPSPQRRVHTLRELADIAPLRAEIRAGGSLLVIGAGVLGCEAAATARALGAQVRIIHAGPAPLRRIVPEPVGEHYRNMHSDNGVEIHDNVVLDSLAGDADGVTATSADGRAWTAATALLAIGAEPNTELARSCGLAVDDGIIVDARYRTSAPGVFAAGDVASRETPDGTRERTEHWNAARDQGVAAAKAILGQPLPQLELPWGWSTQYGRTLQFAGSFRPGDTLVVRGTLGNANFTALAVRDDRLAAVAALGRPAEFRAVRSLISRKATVDAGRCADESIELSAGEVEPATP